MIVHSFVLKDNLQYNDMQVSFFQKAFHHRIENMMCLSRSKAVN